MKINSINQNPSFGRLKITATKDTKKYRDELLKDNMDSIFTEIDLMSGKVPVEIKFNQTIRKNPRITAYVNNEDVYLICPVKYDIDDVYTLAEAIKSELLESHKPKKGTSKYFA